jgi:hypothetical protein
MFILNIPGAEKTNYIHQKVKDPSQKLQTSPEKCPFGEESPYFPLLNSEKNQGVE